MDFSHYVNWGALCFCFVLFLICGPLFAAVTKNKIFSSASWLVVTLWNLITVYIVLIDGEFAKTIVAISAVIVAGLISAVFVLANNPRLGGAKLKIGSNEFEVIKHKEEEKV